MAGEGTDVTTHPVVDVIYGIGCMGLVAWGMWLLYRYYSGKHAARHSK